jgi:hypothetical protein
MKIMFIEVQLINNFLLAMITYFQYTPMTSVNIKCSFINYKNILADYHTNIILEQI